MYPPDDRALQASRALKSIDDHVMYNVARFAADRETRRRRPGVDRSAWSLNQLRKLVDDDRLRNDSAELTAVHEAIEARREALSRLPGADRYRGDLALVANFERALRAQAMEVPAFAARQVAINIHYDLAYAGDVNWRLALSDLLDREADWAADIARVRREFDLGENLRDAGPKSRAAAREIGRQYFLKRLASQITSARAESTTMRWGRGAAADNRNLEQRVVRVLDDPRSGAAVAALYAELGRERGRQLPVEIVETIVSGFEAARAELNDHRTDLIGEVQSSGWKDRPDGTFKAWLTGANEPVSTQIIDRVLDEADLDFDDDRTAFARLLDLSLVEEQANAVALLQQASLERAERYNELVDNPYLPADLRDLGRGADGLERAVALEAALNGHAIEMETVEKGQSMGRNGPDIPPLGL